MQRQVMEEEESWSGDGCELSVGKARIKALPGSVIGGGVTDWIRRVPTDHVPMGKCARVRS